jgi:serine/threonine-protein kinase HipA
MARRTRATVDEGTQSQLPKAVDVYASFDGDDVLAGRLFAHTGRGESATFTYDPGYLSDDRAYALEPALPLVGGPQQTEVGLAMFRSFGDTAPDRWGRRLIERTERLRAEEVKSPARRLTEFAFLLGVRDDLRQGALRFRDLTTGAFIADAETGIPALTELGTLLALADSVERDDAQLEQLRTLLRAGSSLGGARPKAHVRAPDGRAAIAKFPSAASDTWNVMAWEKTALDLAALAGIAVPVSTLLTVAGRHVLVVDRFDRDGDRRIGYVSALTMLEARDGDTGSYMEIGSAIEEHSPHTSADLQQLWRRIAFGVLISNTDDHLRNHGFLHAGGDSWTLAPAFDLNPNPAPGPKELATAISDSGDTRASVENLMHAAPMFRLPGEQAVAALREVVHAAQQWRQVAIRNGLTERELHQMAPAFEHAEAAAARDLVAAAA